MLQRILVPLDGSARAERALPLAVRLARASGGSLVLLRVVPSFPPLTAYGGAPPSPSVPLAEDDVAGATAEANEYLARVAAREGVRSVPARTTVVVGSPGPQICAVAAATQADHIVLSSHGRTGLLRWALGSVADKVVRASPVPVLVVREGGPVPPTDGPVSALVPLDGSPLAEAALGPAMATLRALAGASGGRLRLVQVLGAALSPNGGNPGMVLDEAYRTDVVAKARAYLEATADRLRRDATAGKPLEVMAWVIFADDVATAIIRAAEGGEGATGEGPTGPVDLVAMATHGLGGLQHWVVGSIAERVLHGSKLPLLVVRHAGDGASRQTGVGTQAEPSLAPTP